MNHSPNAVKVAHDSGQETGGHDESKAAITCLNHGTDAFNTMSNDETTDLDELADMIDREIHALEGDGE